MSGFRLLTTIGIAMTCTTGFTQDFKVGERYPDFVLPRIDDREPVSAGSLLGKPTVLIHFASW